MCHWRYGCFNASGSTFLPYLVYVLVKSSHGTKQGHFLCKREAFVYMSVLIALLILLDCNED